MSEWCVVSISLSLWERVGVRGGVVGWVERSAPHRGNGVAETELRHQDKGIERP